MSAAKRGSVDDAHDDQEGSGGPLDVPVLPADVWTRILCFLVDQVDHIRLWPSCRYDSRDPDRSKVPHLQEYYVAQDDMYIYEEQEAQVHELVMATLRADGRQVPPSRSSMFFRSNPRVHGGIATSTTCADDRVGISWPSVTSLLINEYFKELLRLGHVCKNARASMQNVAALPPVSCPGGVSNQALRDLAQHCQTSWPSLRFSFTKCAPRPSDTNVSMMSFGFEDEALQVADVIARNQRGLRTVVLFCEGVDEVLLYGRMIGQSAGGVDTQRGLGSNTVLRTLRLGGDHVSPIGARLLARALATNTALHTLDLGSSTWPGHKEGEIGAEGGTALARAITNNTTLHTLNLGAQNIRDAGAKAMAEMLTSNTGLRAIILRNNDIQDEGIEAIGKSLSRNSSLLMLDISCNPIADVGYKGVAEGLKHNNTLHKLNMVACPSVHHEIEYDKSDGSGAEAIGLALASNRTLHTCVLRDCPIGPRGAAAFGRALAFEHSALHTIELNGPSTGEVEHLFDETDLVGDQGALVIAQGLQYNTSVHVLDLGNSNIADDGAVAIARALKTNTTLRSLNLSENKIEDGGAKALGAALQTNCGLQRLYMSYMCEPGVGPDGFEAIAAGLQLNTGLELLMLGKHEPYSYTESTWQDGDGVFKALGHAFVNNCNLKLQTLSIRNCGLRMGPDGAKAISDGLANSSSLVHFVLHGADMKDVGAKIIAEGLSQQWGKSLYEVDLQVGNNIGAAGTLALTISPWGHPGEKKVAPETWRLRDVTWEVRYSLYLIEKAVKNDALCRWRSFRPDE